ncbi:MAG: glycosyltransferase [Bacteroidota bacterium]|nr:glycosyltransferase [Bacteroidota bacterium]
MEYFFTGFGPYELITLSFLAFVFLIQIGYYLFIFIRVPLFKERNYHYSDTHQPVSIILCARNDAEYLTANLPLFLEQDYPNYEVIVVNDCSDDDTEDVLEKFRDQYSNLRSTQIKQDEKFTHGKKLALTIGIKAAKNEWLLLTDPNCKPADKHWLATMQRNFVNPNEVILGYGGFEKKKGLVNKFIRFDAFFTAIQYFSFALIGLPFMGVGRNLSYRKSLFLRNKGFASHAQILPGDDNLFVSEVAIKRNTRVEFSHKSHTRAVPLNYHQWKIYKKLYFSTVKNYKFGVKFLLRLESFSRVFFLLGTVLVVVNPKTWIIGTAVFAFRLIIQLLVFNSAMGKLNEKSLLFQSVFFDIISPFVNIPLYLRSPINTNQHKWN